MSPALSQVRWQVARSVLDSLLALHWVAQVCCSFAHGSAQACAWAAHWAEFGGAAIDCGDDGVGV